MGGMIIKPAVPYHLRYERGGHHDEGAGGLGIAGENLNIYHVLSGKVIARASTIQQARRRMAFLLTLNIDWEQDR